MKKLLLVDDNDKYARLLSEYFTPLGYEIERAVNASEGLELFSKNEKKHFDVIVTDITMESQLAGIFMIRKIHKMGFAGISVIASTGFDVPMGMFFSRLFLRPYGVDYLVPKTSVIKKTPLFYSMKGSSRPLEIFPA